MFDLLKKKIGSFISAFSKKEEEAPPAQPAAKAEEELVAPLPKEEVAAPQHAEIPAPQLPAVEHHALEVEKHALEVEGEKPREVVEKNEPLFVAPKVEQPSVPKPAVAPKPAQEIPKPFSAALQSPAPAARHQVVPSAQQPAAPAREIPKPQPAAQQPQAPKPAYVPPAPPSPVPDARHPVVPPASQPSAPKPQVQPAPVAQPVVPVPSPKPVSSFVPLKIEEPKKEREFAPKLGILSQLKSVFTNKVKISEEETRGLFEELELALLESDVSYGTAQALVLELKKRLVGREVEKGKVGEEVRAEISGALLSLLQQQDYDVFAKISECKKAGSPCKILFLGPNGAGKTTTIAKMAFLLKQRGFSSVISASDTFRAAAIEQAVFHGERLGVKVIKHEYGADPAAVAFDAIRHGQANKLDVVLIDTAGRQETNRNLVEEMKKISRVCAPDIRLFVGEAVSGNALVEQLKAFKQAVGVDGIILTKVDCDAKGGNSLSIARETGVPVVFLGMGQEYSDLVPFDAGIVVQKVMES
ncbi:MAG: signal recognition particle-docking protein FtsY [Candidatus Micrarchaeia archaeon]